MKKKILFAATVLTAMTLSACGAGPTTTTATNTTTRAEALSEANARYAKYLEEKAAAEDAVVKEPIELTLKNRDDATIEAGSDGVYMLDSMQDYYISWDATPLYEDGEVNTQLVACGDYTVTEEQTGTIDISLWDHVKQVLYVGQLKVGTSGDDLGLEFCSDYSHQRRPEIYNGVFTISLYTSGAPSYEHNGTYGANGSFSYIYETSNYNRHYDAAPSIRLAIDDLSETELNRQPAYVGKTSVAPNTLFEESYAYIPHEGADPEPVNLQDAPRVLITPNVYEYIEDFGYTSLEPDEDGVYALCPDREYAIGWDATPLLHDDNMIVEVAIATDFSVEMGEVGTITVCYGDYRTSTVYVGELQVVATDGDLTLEFAGYAEFMIQRAYVTNELYLDFVSSGDSTAREYGGYIVSPSGYCYTTVIYK